MRNLILLTAVIAALAAPAAARADQKSAIWLAEVSADPRDGSDWLQLDLERSRFDRLELAATGDDVLLRSVSLHLPDGTVVTTKLDAIIPAGTRRIVDVPRRVGRIDSIELDYGSPSAHKRDRSRARLQLTAHSR